MLSLPHILILMVIVGPLYFVPAIVAFTSNKRQKVAILLLNLFAGWTGIGWIVALVWSVAGQRDGTGGSA